MCERRESTSQHCLMGQVFLFSLILPFWPEDSDHECGFALVPKSIASFSHPASIVHAGRRCSSSWRWCRSIVLVLVLFGFHRCKMLTTAILASFRVLCTTLWTSQEQRVHFVPITEQNIDWLTTLHSSNVLMSTFLLFFYMFNTVKGLPGKWNRTTNF